MLAIPFFLLMAIAQHIAAAYIPHYHVIHEKRDVTRRMPAEVDSSTIVPVRISLKPSYVALEQAEIWLTNVSEPTSKHFGRYWSKNEVDTAFKPSWEARTAVETWLELNMISSDRMVISRDRAWIAFDASIGELESMLHAHYYYSSGSLACDSYMLPKHISKHVDYITPGIKGLRLRRRINRRKRAFRPKQRLTKLDTISTSLDDCDKSITPACVRALYDIPLPNTDVTPAESNSLGIFEEGDYYSEADLDAFFSKYTEHVPESTYPSLSSIDGGEAPMPLEPPGSESALDFEVAIPIIYPQSATLYQVDDEYYAHGGNGSTHGWFNTFLDALDGSYCAFSAYGETGNDPVLDPTYPHAGGYNKTLQCGVFKPTNVISISYGVQEEDLPVYYQKRQCLEFLKLALQGVTVIVASGDTGVGGWPGHRGKKNGCMKNDTVFNPTQPNSCPFVTNVGATKIYPGGTVYDLESAAVDPPGHPYSWGFSSSGGFSNLFAPAAYQRDTINEYFHKHDPGYPYYFDGHYNSSHGLYNRNGRGIPDVAAIGDNIAVVRGGIDFKMSGTSASAPIFAAIINRVVEERIRIGKGPLGFINSALYANPHVFNDIVNGSNPGCGTQGFSCVPGWDPVTGLGTPNYPKLLEMFLALP